MNTIEYLQTLTSLLQQPKAAEILNKHCPYPEIYFGQIDIDDYTAFLNLYTTLNRIKGVKTSPIQHTGLNPAFTFTVTTPITIDFTYPA